MTTAPAAVSTAAAKRPLARDKADTLLLLAGCALVLAPHALQVPGWIALLCGALLAWRSWITFSGVRLPPRWLLLPLALLAMAGVYIQYKTLLGQQAGIAMLTLLLAFKLLEMHARRDLFVTLYLGFFLILTGFLHSQEIGAALMALTATIVLLGAQLSFQYTGMVPPLRQRLWLGARVAAYAVPLMLLLFLLFPRIEGPLWRMPGDANAGRTGLSETMEPGNIAQLAMSENVAFRVRFLGAVPPRPQLYWRGIVMDSYDGRSWKHDSVPLPMRAAPPRSEGLSQIITLEPHGRHWLFALELPQAAPQLPDATPATLAADGSLRSARPVRDRLRYTAISDPDTRLQADTPRIYMQRLLDLPPGYNPATLAFAADLRRESDDPLKIADRILQTFREQPFRYTLEPPLLGRHAMDEFLFTHRAGFCEHYASAFVVLMRAAGVPARVVTGYQGGELNPVDNFLTVRQSDAHAWAEIWVEGRGWLRYDPTAAVAPERIEMNLASTQPQDGLAGVMNQNAVTRSWITALRYNWDAINNGWNQWVLSYSSERQHSLLQRLGFDNADWRVLVWLTLAGGAIFTALMALRLLGDRRKLDPLRALHERFCRRMAARGLARAPHEGPLAYRQRIGREASGWTEQKKSAALRFLECYEAAQYGRVRDLSPGAQLAQLKHLLKQCR